MDGLALIRRLRADGQRDLPVVVVSGRREYRDAAAELGVDAYLVKPVALRQLADTVERLLAEQRAGDAGT